MQRTKKGLPFHGAASSSSVFEDSHPEGLDGGDDGERTEKEEEAEKREFDLDTSVPSVRL